MLGAKMNVVCLFRTTFEGRQRGVNEASRTPPDIGSYGEPPRARFVRSFISGHLQLLVSTLRHVHIIVVYSAEPRPLHALARRACCERAWSRLSLCETCNFRSAALLRLSTLHCCFYCQALLHERVAAARASLPAFRCWQSGVNARLNAQRFAAGTEAGQVRKYFLSHTSSFEDACLGTAQRAGTDFTRRADHPRRLTALPRLAGVAIACSCDVHAYPMRARACRHSSLVFHCWRGTDFQSAKSDFFVQRLHQVPEHRRIGDSSLGSVACSRCAALHAARRQERSARLRCCLPHFFEPLALLTQG